MTDKFVVCGKCKERYYIGDYPFCPHGKGIGGYDAFTPTTDDMIAPDPITFGNRGERSRFMDRNAIVPKNVEHFRPGRAVYLDLKSR